MKNHSNFEHHPSNQIKSNQIKTTMRLLLPTTTSFFLGFDQLHELQLQSLITTTWFFTFLTVLFLFQYITRVRQVSGHSPPSYPFIGCLISFYNNRYRLLDWYTDLIAASPTNTIVVKRLGATRTIVTANPENVEYMLQTNFNNFPKGKPFTEILGDLLGHGIFNADGQLWRMQRKIASHGFSTGSLREYLTNTLSEQIEKKLLPVLESAMKENKVVDLQELLRRFAFVTVCKVSFGSDPAAAGSIDPCQSISSLERAFDVATMISARRATAPVYAVWKFKRAFGIESEKQLSEAIKHVRESVSEMIQSKREKQLNNNNNNNIEGDNGGDLLTRLISDGHDEEMIVDMVISFIMAGRDTTSAAMTWLFWLLSCHPNVEKDVLNEINNINNNNNNKIIKEEEDEKLLLSLDFEGLKEMKLLKACLCESMRLYPPVAWDSKHAVTDDVLPDGTTVRPGDRVTYFPYGMGRMEGLWGKDRLEFKPDRWFSEPDKGGEMRNVSPYKFPVFQAGPRVCLGKEMSFVQMKYVVASILNRFEIKPVGSDQPVFVPFLTAQMAGGFRVKVLPRR